MKYVAVITRFFENMSASSPILRRPAMLENKISSEAVAQVAFSTFWSKNPASLKTNFMCRLIDPIDPMEQMLPSSSNQNGPLRKRWAKLCGACFASLGGASEPSGNCPISAGLSFKRNSESGHARNISPPIDK